MALSSLQYLRDVLTLDTTVDIARFEDAAVVPRVAPRKVHQVLESVLEVSAFSLARGASIAIDCREHPLAAVRKYVRRGNGKRGMGLYLCRLVVEARGGRIDHEAPEIGPVSSFRLPGRA